MIPSINTCFSQMRTYVFVVQASVAKLESSISLYGDKLELKLYGFNDKLSVLLSKVLAIANSFSPKDDRFKVCCFPLPKLLNPTRKTHSSVILRGI